MAEHISITNGISKELKYQELMPQIKSIIEGEPDLVANLANIGDALKETFNLFWVGFYVVKDEKLVLASFPGGSALKRIN